MTFLMRYNPPANDYQYATRIRKQVSGVRDGKLTVLLSFSCCKSSTAIGSAKPPSLSRFRFPLFSTFRFVALLFVSVVDPNTSSTTAEEAFPFPLSRTRFLSGAKGTLNIPSSATGLCLCPRRTSLPRLAMTEPPLSICVCWVFWRFRMRSLDALKLATRLRSEPENEGGGLRGVGSSGRGMRVCGFEVGLGLGVTRATERKWVGVEEEGSESEAEEGSEGSEVGESFGLGLGLRKTMIWVDSI